jgi:selenocysteine lyase/cysteine desulfurase
LSFNAAGNNWGGTDRTESLAHRTHRPGTSDASAWLAAPCALEFHDTVLQPARPAALRLLGWATAALETIGFVRVGCQEDDIMMASYWVPDWIEADEIFTRLQRASVEAIVTGQAGRSLLRISVAWYTSEDEVARLLEVCSSFA